MNFDVDVKCNMKMNLDFRMMLISSLFLLLLPFRSYSSFPFEPCGSLDESLKFTNPIMPPNLSLLPKLTRQKIFVIHNQEYRHLSTSR